MRPRGKNHTFFTSRPPKTPFQSRKTPCERQKQAVFYLSAFQQTVLDYSETEATGPPQRKERFGLVLRDRSLSIPPTAPRRAPPSHEAEGGHAIQISPSSAEDPMGVRKVWVISLSFRALSLLSFRASRRRVEKSPTRYPWVTCRILVMTPPASFCKNEGKVSLHITKNISSHPRLKKVKNI